MARRISLTPKRISYLVFGLAVCGVVAYLFYLHVAVLEPTGRRYNESLAVAVPKLNASCQQLSKNSDKLLVERALVPADVKRDHIRVLRTDADKLRNELERFKSESGSLPGIQLTFTSSMFAKSQQLMRQGASTTSEISSVLDEYEQLLSFLAEYYELRQEMDDSLAAFNAYTDLNLLIDNTGGLYENAKAIDDKATILARTQTPRGFEGQKDAMLNLARRTGQALRTQADSYFPPTDEAIYSSARTLEAITSENEKLNNEMLDKTIGDLPIIKSVGDLPEITDRFKF